MNFVAKVPKESVVDVEALVVTPSSDTGTVTGGGWRREGGRGEEEGKGSEEG